MAGKTPKKIITMIISILIFILADAEKLPDINFDSPSFHDCMSYLKDNADYTHDNRISNLTDESRVSDFNRFDNLTERAVVSRICNLTESGAVHYFNSSLCCRAVYRNRSIGPWIKNSLQLGGLQSDNTSGSLHSKRIPYPDFFIAPMGSEPSLNCSRTWLGFFNITNTVTRFSSAILAAVDEIYAYFGDRVAMDGALAARGHDPTDPHQLNSFKDYDASMVDYQHRHRYLAAMVDDHVGIDASVAKFSMDKAPQSLSAGNMSSWYVSIDYNGTENTVCVFLSNVSSKPMEQILHVGHINLSKYLPENVFVRLSVSTQHSNKIKTTISWEFSAQTTWNQSSIRVFINVILIVSIISIALWLLAIFALSVVVFRVLRRMIKTLSTTFTTFSVAVFRVLSCIHVKIWLRPVQPGEIHRNPLLELAIVLKNPRQYKYNELSVATSNFREDQKLGGGGFGIVYKGILQDSSETVAVKRISSTSGQGTTEYLSEINILGELKHRSLVPLLGWCHEKAEELLLVYKFMPNGSLDNYLFGSGADRPTLKWNMRYKIEYDLALALHYLHDECEQPVLHRDIKSSNIMLDADFNSKLGDFGLSRKMEHSHTSHFTNPGGTYGYLAPESVMSGKASAMSDVFSFGVVALEIACGRRALDTVGQLDETCYWPLVKWVWDLYGKECILDAADKRLNGEWVVTEMRQLMVVGLWCSNPDCEQRPKIRQALQTLRFEAPLPNLPSNMMPNLPTNMPNIFELSREQHSLGFSQC